MIKLHNLKPLVKKRKRIGRGGSRGGTSTKGHKGQTARSGGNVRLAFEGGQMPLFRRLPKRGFSNFDFKKDVCVVNLGQLETTFEAGARVTRETLLEKGLVHMPKGVAAKAFTIKVLAKGTLTKKLLVAADAFSESAKKAIEGLGGEAHLIKES